MKKAIGMAIIMLFVGSTAAMAQGIGGSAHDFSGQGWSGGEICQVCHTPHNSDDTVVEAPLWDHELSAAAYTPYSGTDMQATVGQPDAESKLCLACHEDVASDIDGKVGFHGLFGKANEDSCATCHKDHLGRDV